MPKYSSAQQTGQVGESMVFHLLTQAGLIVHHVSADNDFGIDARVEIPRPDRTLAGAEFNLQVKTSSSVEVSLKTGRLKIHSVRVETAAYWHSKLSPTLLVVSDLSQNEIYYEWAHVAITGDRIVEAIRSGSKTVIPYVPAANALTEGVVSQLVSAAHKSYGQMVASALGGQIRDDGLVLYRAIADAVDILLEWITGLAFQRPEVRAQRVLETHTNINHLDERYLRDARRYSLIPPLHATTIMPANQLYAAILAFRSLMLFVNIVEGLPDEDVRTGAIKDSPLVSASRTTAELVKRLYLEAYAPHDTGYQKLAELALYRDGEDGIFCLAAPIVLVERALAVITLVLRDYMRNLRVGLFPLTPITEPANPFQQIGVLAYSDTKAALHWLSEDGDGSPSARSETPQSGEDA